MSEKWECLLCGKEIGMWDKKCPHCGQNQFGDNNEYYPTAFHCAKAKKILNGQNKKKAKKLSLFFDPIYSLEERLALGLYPKDESYKMSLISLILGRKRK